MNLDQNQADRENEPKKENKKPYYKKNTGKPQGGQRPQGAGKPQGTGKPQGANKPQKDKKSVAKTQEVSINEVEVTNKPEANKAQPSKGYQGKKPYNKKFSGRKPMAEGEVQAVEVDENVLFGRNSVIEVLKSGRDVEKILIQKGQVEGSIKKIIGDAKARGIVIQEVEKSKLDEISNGERHQGVVAYASAHKYVEIDEILNDAKAKGEDPFILILENIQDPHNLGAIIRSAHNAGVHGIIISKRRAVGLTSTVSKASAGAIEYTKVAKVANIAQTIEELKSKGIWVACADMDGEIIYTDNLRGPIGIVIGSEGEGVSRNVKSKCDFVVRIPMYGKVTSLNASVAASILAYEVVRQRHF